MMKNVILTRQSLSLKLINLFSSIFSVLGFIIAIHVYSSSSSSVELMIIQFDNDFALTYIVKALNAIGLTLLIIHQYLSLPLYRKSKLSLFFHTALFLFSPALSSAATICIPLHNVYTCYSINELIIVIMGLRVVHLLLALIQFSVYFDYYSPKLLNGRGPTLFAIRCQFTFQKAMMNTVLLILGTFYCGLAFWVFERRKESTDLFIDYKNSLWCAFESGYTIGYGDIYPKTLLGRAAAAIWIFFGTGFSWFVVLAIGQKYNLENMDFLVFKDINRITVAEKLIKRFMQKKDFSMELKEFREERYRQYVAGFDFGTIFFDLYATPPSDFRQLNLKVKQLENSYEELYKNLLGLAKRVEKNLTINHK